MKKIKIIALVLVTVSVLFTACQKPQKFETAPIITTTRTVTEAETFAYSEFTMLKAKLGMSIEETQKAVGQTINLYPSEKGQYYFVVAKKDLPFVTKDTETAVYFIFDGNYRLCEIQYESSEATGFNLDNAIKEYDSKYGRHVKVQSETEKVNYVWFSEGAYILITTTASGRNAMTFASESFFEQNNPQEFKTYNE